MVLHNPGNWHWVNKDARDWAKDYFTTHLTVITASEGDISAKIEKVLSSEGDVDVSQRKGKVITLFDVKVQLEYSGKTASGDAVTGTITIPEVAHDTESDEYVFEIQNHADSKEKQPVRDLVRTKITPQIRDALSKFAGDLVAEHSKDIQHAPGSGPASGSSTPKPASQTGQATSKPSTKPTETVHTHGSVMNTVTLKDNVEFQTSADSLYRAFVDPKMVTAFTREAPKVFEPKVGGKFSLFGGNVDGAFKILEQNKKIVQDWRLATWPKGHYSTLTLVFDQGTDTTTLRLTWDGVPVGQEDVSKRNFDEYYVRSIKTTFGFGAVL